MAAVRSSSIPMTMKCVGVSARGHFKCMSPEPRIATFQQPATFERRDVHLAVDGVPSPTSEQRTRRSVHRDVQRRPRNQVLLSRLPAWTPAARLPTRPAYAATPMLPKKRSGQIDLLKNCATLRRRSNGMMSVRAIGKFGAKAPPRRESVVGIRDLGTDLEGQQNLQHIAGLRAST